MLQSSVSLRSNPTWSVDKERVKQLVRDEENLFRQRAPSSLTAHARSKRVLPLGVASSLQAYDPHPLFFKSANGSTLVDVDGNSYIDFSLGFGSLLTGHCHPVFTAAIREQLQHGTLLTTASELHAEVAELLIKRFPVDKFRFCNSGTEAVMDAIRIARAFTGQTILVKTEGGYHGHSDTTMYSMKPSLDKAGDPNRPNVVPSSGGLPPSMSRELLIVPYNDPAALDRVLTEYAGQVAAFIVEPIAQNIGIVEPQPGYLRAVRDITRKHGVLLICDEVKTGVTCHWGGASTLYNIDPDLICLAKSIGGGVPIGAFGGRAEVMDVITTGKALHMGTFNGNPLSLAAARAVLRDIITQEAFNEVKARNERMVADFNKIIQAYDLPAHTITVGAKGCVTFSRQQLRNYRDYKATDFDLAYLYWLYNINRGIYLPPGLDDQWTLSVMHTDADCQYHAHVFEQFCQTVSGLRLQKPIIPLAKVPRIVANAKL